MIRNLLLLLFTFSLLSPALSQVEKTFVKSFKAEGLQEVALDLNGPVEIRTWPDQLVRVQMTIRASLPEATLMSLLRAGRYNIAGQQTGGILKVTLPDMAREILLNGERIDEQVSFVVFVPDETPVRQLQATATTATTTQNEDH